MVEDEELDEIIKEREIALAESKTSNLVAENTNFEDDIPKFESTTFAAKMEDVKQNILVEASAEDQNFVDTVKKNVKEAAVRHTEVEKDKADYEKQQVQYASEKLERKQHQNEHAMAEDKWTNRQKRRQYHFDGVAPIMNFVGITQPMNLFILYFLTAVLIWFFLLSKLFRGTIGALIAGACDSDRPKAIKGCLWTSIFLILLLVVAALIYLFLKWQQIV